MRTNLLKFGSASFMALAMVMGSPVQASEGGPTGADKGNGQKIFENGKGDVPACNSCHGPAGLGDDNMGTPRLAGQGYQFLVKQLEDFATDRRQDTTMFVMNTNAKGLSSQDRRDVAAYVNSLTKATRGKQLQQASGGSDLAALQANGVVVGQPHLGKAIVNFGDTHRKIPACLSCHGFNGRGVDPVYPKIGEQKYVYLTNQLKKWRDGSRANDPMAQMQKVAQQLTDDDIANVASYLTNAPQTTLGNTGVPAEHLP
jgi:cytochrome c553